MRSETAYNTNGQAFKTSTNIIEYGTVTGGVFTKSTDPADTIRTNEQVTEQFFDARGQVIRTKLPDGNSTYREFDVLGRVTAEIDQLGNRKDMSYNSAGQLTQIQLPSVPNPLNGNTPCSESQHCALLRTRTRRYEQDKSCTRDWSQQGARIDTSMADLLVTSCSILA